MATNVNLPEGFILDEPGVDPGTLSYRREKDLMKAVAFSPTEQADIDRQEAMPSVLAELDREIAKTKDPKIKAILVAERQARGGGSPSSLPEGFVVDTPEPAKRGIYDVLTGPKVAGGAAKGVDTEGVGVAENILNRAKVGVMALPGLLGSLQKGRDVLTGALPADQRKQVEEFSALLNPTQVIEKAILGARKGLGLAGEGASTALPTSEELATSLLGYKPGLKPRDTTSKLAGEAAEFFASMAAGPGGFVGAGVRGGVGAGAKTAAEAALLSGAVAGGGELAERALGEGEIAKAGGQLASVVPYAWLRARVGALSSLATSAGRQELKEAVTGAAGPVSKDMQDLFRKQAEEQLRAGIKEYPPSLENIKESTSLQQKINAALAGTDETLSLSAGRASGAPRIVADELTSRRSSNANVAAALADEQRNMSALLTYMTEAPESGVSRKAALDRIIADFNTKRDMLAAEEKIIQERAWRLADALAPTTTAEQRGAKLVELRGQEQARENVVRNHLYGVAREEADRLGATFDRSTIDSVAERIAKNPILQYDAQNMPAVIRNIRGAAEGALDAETQKALSAVNPDKAEQLRQRLSAGAKVLAAEEQAAKPLSFADVSAMKQAVNQDIAVELRSTNPNKRQRLRALTEMSNTIDGAIAESKFPSVAQLYGAANDYYRNTYAPKFNKGINAKLAMTDSLGQQRVIDEKVLDQYLSNTNGANQFAKLFGGNAEAKAVMEEHVLDRLGRATIKDGTIDPAAYARWLVKNNDVLRTLEGAGVQSLERVRNIKSAMDALNARRANLAANEEKVAKDELTRLLGTTEHGIIVEKALSNPSSMGRLTNALGEMGSKALASSVLRDIQNKFAFKAESGGVGIDAARFSKWLDSNETSLKILFKRAYGDKDGIEHLQRLQDANRMLAIQQRVPTVRAARDTESNVGKDPLAQRLGFSFRTLFNMVRATIAGRTSTPDVGVALGGQAASFLATKSYNDMMARIATDPQSSKYLLELVKGDAKKVLTKEEVTRQAKAIAGIMSGLGHLYLGTAHYLPSMGRLAPAAISGLTEDLGRREDAQSVRSNAR